MNDKCVILNGTKWNEESQKNKYFVGDSSLTLGMTIVRDSSHAFGMTCKKLKPDTPNKKIVTLHKRQPVISFVAGTHWEYTRRSF